MIRKLRRKLSYANVVASLALFVALGGSSYAALTITGRQVRNGSLTHSDLKRNTLGGNRVKESSLGRVPRAHAADLLNGKTAEQLLVRCPPGTVPVSDVCVETAARSAAPYRIAAGICEAVDRRTAPGRRLPTHEELMTAIGDFGITLAAGGELTSNVYPSTTNPGRVDVLFITNDVGDVGLISDTAADTRSFRCVTDPIN